MLSGWFWRGCWGHPLSLLVDREHWGTVRCRRWHWGGAEGDEHSDSIVCTQPAPQGCGQQPRAWLTPLSSVPLNPVTPCRNAFPAPQAPLYSPNPPRVHPPAPIPCCPVSPILTGRHRWLILPQICCLAKRDRAHLQQLPLDQLLMLSGAGGER